MLAVDLDPQGNLSDYLDVDPDAVTDDRRRAGRRAKPREAVHDGIIPANLGLAEAELMLGGKMGRELTLKRALRELKRDYDVILIDCPPALGLLTVNALVASDYALLSAEAQYFALQGVEQALEVIELARDSLNPDLEWLGVVLNIADMRTAPLARGVRLAARALRREADRHDDPRLDRRTPSRPSGPSRSSTTAPTSPPTTSTWPTSCSAGSGWTRSARPRCMRARTPQCLRLRRAPRATRMTAARPERAALRPRAAARRAPPWPGA